MNSSSTAKLGRPPSRQNNDVHVVLVSDFSIFCEKSAAPSLRQINKEPIEGSIAVLKRQRDALLPSPIVCNETSRFTDRILTSIFEFVAADLKGAAPLCAVCRRWYSCTFGLVRSIVLIPDQVLASRMCEAVLSSLTLSLKSNARGRNVRSFSITNNTAVYSLRSDVPGPAVLYRALHSVLGTLPSLVSLDLRGIDLQGWRSWQDTLLSSLQRYTPQLESLKIGPQLIGGWESAWWSALPLTEFVVGSRREDVDSIEPLSLLSLPEDFFTMIRSPSHGWKTVKLWTRLQRAAFNALLFPSAPFPKLQHLSVNVHGNSQSVLERKEEVVVEDKKKPVDKKGKSMEADALKVLFPALCSVALSEVGDGLFCAHYSTYLAVQAPQLKYFTVTNSHTQAPCRPTPPPVKTRKTIPS